MELARLLISYGASLDAKDQRGWTPLMMASHRGNRTMVEILVEAGADLRCEDKFGKKAHDRASTSEIFYYLASRAFERRMKSCASTLRNVRGGEAPKPEK